MLATGFTNVNLLLSATAYIRTTAWNHQITYFISLIFVKYVKK